ncbi:MAG: hypothetical protein AAGB10_00540 [Pseudomonadota bacterium]
MKRIAVCLALLSAVPALAHQLVVYAYADAGEVVVEARFSNGNPAKQGEIRLLNAEALVLVKAPLEDDGETRLAVPDGADGGLTVEVETDAGHSDYWILTPSDLGLEAGG